MRQGSPLRLGQHDAKQVPVLLVALEQHIDEGENSVARGVDRLDPDDDVVSHSLGQGADDLLVELLLPLEQLVERGARQLGCSRDVGDLRVVEAFLGEDGRRGGQRVCPSPRHFLGSALLARGANASIRHPILPIRDQEL